MASVSSASSPLGSLFGDGTLGTLSDGQLLERFLAGGPAAGTAFEVLMHRHGPMVLSVCRGVVGDRHEAEECFQATFLVLVRRAGAIRRRPSLGPWLHGVARRVSLKAVAATRHRERLALAAIDGYLSREPVCVPAEIDELGPALHEEIARLPEEYRAPITLCYLQGRTIADAARQLGWPAGTVAGRLARARDRLRDRLMSRGLTPSLSVLAVPASLLQATRRIADRLATEGQAGGAGSTFVSQLVDEVLRTMIWTRLKIGAAGLLLGALTAGAVGMSVSAGAFADPPPTRQVGREPSPAAAGEPEPDMTARALREAAGLVADIPDAKAQIDTYVSLAWAQIKTGDKASARENLDRAAGASTRLEPFDRGVARARIARAMGGADDPGRGLALLDIARRDADRDDLRTRFLLWNKIVDARTELGDWAGAKETLGAFVVAWQKLEPNAEERSFGWPLLVECQLAAGEVDEAFRTCDSAEQPSARRGLYAAIAVAAASVDDLGRYPDPPRSITPDEKARRLAVVRRAVSAAESTPGGCNESRSELAIALARLGAFDEALRLLRGTDRLARPATPGDFSAFWRICELQARAGDRDGARRTYREAEKIDGFGIGNGRYGSAWASLAVRDAAVAIAKAEQFEPFFRSQLLSMVAVCKRRDGDLDGARTLFKRALIEAHRDLDSLTPANLPGVVPAKNIEEARAFHRASTMGLIAAIHARAGDWRAAARALDEIRSDEAGRIMAARTIALFRARAGDVAGATFWARSLSDPALRGGAIRGLSLGIYGEPYIRD